MELRINFGKGYFVIIVLAVGLLTWAGIVFANVNQALPNHPASQVSLPSGNSLTEALGTLPSGGVICTSENSASDASPCYDEGIRSCTYAGCTTPPLWQGTSSIYYNGGNVGIGLSNPVAKLEVNGDVRSDGGLVIAGTHSSTDAGITIDSYPNYRKIQTWGQKPLVINPEGNDVGIGTNSPQATLDVDGSVRTEGLTVTSSVNFPSNTCVIREQSSAPNQTSYQEKVCLDGEILTGGGASCAAASGQGVLKFSYPYSTTSTTPDAWSAGCLGISTIRLYGICCF